MMHGDCPDQYHAKGSLRVQRLSCRKALDYVVAQDSDVILEYQRTGSRGGTS